MMLACSFNEAARWDARKAFCFRGVEGKTIGFNEAARWDARKGMPGAEAEAEKWLQ